VLFLLFTDVDGDVCSAHLFLATDESDTTARDSAQIASDESNIDDTERIEEAINENTCESEEPDQLSGNLECQGLDITYQDASAAEQRW
jgi:hypothetical protein